MAEEEQRGQLVTRLREQRLWTRERLAQEAGVSTTTITGVEEGRTRVRLGTIEKLANALEVDPVTLLHPEEEHEATAVPKEPPPRSMDELLDRAGIADRHLTLSLDEIDSAFKGLSYREAYDLVRKIAAARQAAKAILDEYKGTPEGEALAVESMERNMNAILSFQAIAEREEKQVSEQGDSERVVPIRKQRQEMRRQMRRLAKEAV